MMTRVSETVLSMALRKDHLQAAVGKTGSHTCMLARDKWESITLLAPPGSKKTSDIEREIQNVSVYVYSHGNF